MEQTNVAMQVIPGNEVFEKYKVKRWFLLAYGALMMIAVALCYAWSILSGPISQAFADWNEALGGLTFTLFMYSYAIFGLVGGIIANKLKTVKINLIVSAVLMLTSFLLTSFAQGFVLLYIGFSFLGGIGVAFTYNAVIVNMTKWFTDRIGVATGILLMGYGLGSFILGNVYTLIYTALDWRTAFVIMGIAIAVILLIGAFLMSPPPADYIAPVRPPKTDRFPVETMECTPIQMIKRVSFWILFVMGICCSMPGMVISSFGRQLITTIDPEMLPSLIALVVGAIPIANGVGRICTGFVNDWFGMGFNIRISGALVFTGTALVLVAFSTGAIPFLVAAFIIMGFCSGMSVPDGAVVTRKLFGEKYYQINLQVLLLAGFINSLGTLMFGGLYEVSGGYVLPLIVLSVIAFIGALSAWFIKKP